MLLRSLTIKNYRSLEDVRLEKLGQFNVLIGRNNSGKSSVFGVLQELIATLGAGGAGLCHYSASKGGVIAFTKALAREAASHGVLVNAIAPGPIKTGIMPPGDAEEDRDREAALPIGRFGEVGEVAPTAVFLASDDASYYVGQTLGPNGGDVML